MPLCPIKWHPLKFFAKLHKHPLLIADIVKGAVSDLRQFLPTKSPWKIMINLCLNIWFIKTSNCQQSFFGKRSRQKKHKFFIFLKDRYFVMGSPIDMNVGVFWETSGLSKMCGFSTFPEIQPKFCQFECQNLTAFKK